MWNHDRMRGLGCVIVLVLAASVAAGCTTVREVRGLGSPVARPTQDPSASPSVFVPTSPIPKPSTYTPPALASTAPPVIPATSPSPQAGVVDCGSQASSSSSGVDVSTSTTCYSVQGNSMAAISADVGNSGPTVEGESAVAVTRWQIEWGYTKTSDATSCELSAPTVDLTITFLYPRLTSPASPAAGEWANYIADEVVPHEERHKQIALDGATKLLTEISKESSSATCSQLDAAVKAIGNKVTDQTKQKQDAFDKAEAHV